MKNILEEIIKKVVMSPEDVKVQEMEGSGNYIVYEIEVKKEDRGRLIGKNGKTYNLIFDLMKIIASKNSKKIHLTIIE